MCFYGLQVHIVGGNPKNGKNFLAIKKVERDLSGKAVKGNKIS
jgi:hypothetical protein